VDWASLAKQWIAQREVMGLTSSIVTLSNSDTLSHYMSQPMQQVPVAPPPPPPPPQSTDDVTPDDHLVTYLQLGRALHRRTVTRDQHMVWHLSYCLSQSVFSLTRFRHILESLGFSLDFPGPGKTVWS